MSDLIDRGRLKERLFPGLLELSRGTSKTGIALYKQGWNDAITSIIENEPSAEPDDWLEKNKDLILQAGMEGREVEFRLDGRLFAIREKAQ